VAATVAQALCNMMSAEQVGRAKHMPKPATESDWCSVRCFNARLQVRLTGSKGWPAATALPAPGVEEHHMGQCQL
jgi:hypothetical protein